jgi:hypothetical protein
MPLIEQELLTLHGAPEFNPDFECGFVLLDLYVSVCFVDRYLSFWSLIYPSVRLRFMDSDYTFAFLKIFLTRSKNLPLILIQA